MKYFQEYWINFRLKMTGKECNGHSPSAANVKSTPQPPSADNVGQVENGGAQLRKSLGLIDGSAIIVGVIIGAGIFVSPKGVLLHAGSTGFAIIIWVLSGLLSMVGAMCYAELGTMIPRSGGDYTYILASLGPLPAFLFLYGALIILVPTGNAVLGLTFSFYILQPMWPDCDPPDTAVRLLSAAVIAFLTAVNCYNVKWVTMLQDGFTAMKLIALFTIILSGGVVLFQGDTKNIEEPFEGTALNPQSIAMAFYSGMFSYSGWNYLNLVTEELRNPFKNLPRAIRISLPLVTIVYSLTNLAYFVVLSKSELLNSNAVAVSFGDSVLGVMSWIIPFFVACSTFGGLNAGIFAPSRLVFTAAREGHLPKALAIVNVDTGTPIPALIFLGAVSILMLVIKDVYVLINYMSFMETMGWTASVLGLLWLRWKQPDLPRPIKVNIILPILFLILCGSLLIIPILFDPSSECVASLAVIASGIPVYFIFVYWENKPQWIRRLAALGSRVGPSIPTEEDPLLHNSSKFLAESCQDQNQEASNWTI